MPIKHHDIVKAIWFDVQLDFKVLAASQLAAKALASGFWPCTPNTGRLAPLRFHYATLAELREQPGGSTLAELREQPGDTVTKSI